VDWALQTAVTVAFVELELEMVSFDPVPLVSPDSTDISQSAGAPMAASDSAGENQSPMTNQALKIPKTSTRVKHTLPTSWWNSQLAQALMSRVTYERIVTRSKWLTCFTMVS
jgi:hypothetical protein